MSIQNIACCTDFSENAEHAFVTALDLAEKYQTALVPFLLKDVGGIPELNQADGIHPTEEGHRIIAETVWEVLEPVVGVNGPIP